MTPHAEILSERQREVLSLLCPRLKRTRFYLAGGTAAALYLGHRRSEYLDWFTPASLPNLRELEARLSGGGIPLKVVSTGRGTLYMLIGGVQVSFIEYRYPLLAPVADSLGCKLASLDDIACMKLSTIGHRGARRDFVDLYAILKNHKPPDTLIRLYKKKYGTRDIAHLLRALSYFDDAEREPMPNMLWDVDWKAIRSEIESRLLQYVNAQR